MATAAEAMQIGDTSVPLVVLVSSQHGGVGIMRSLGRLGVPVYGVHRESWEPSTYSRYLRGFFRWDFTTARADESLEFMRTIRARVARKPILLATSDRTALFLAENAEALREDFLFRAPPADVVRTLYNKREMHFLSQELNIPVAECIFPRSFDEVRRFAETANFPVVVKGEDAELVRKGGPARVAVVQTAAELFELYRLNNGARPPSIILQEYIPGGDDTVWMFNGYFDERSECLMGATGRKLRQYPPHRGSTSLGICEKNEAVAEQTKQLAKAVGYRGILDIGYRYDARDGSYKLLDVNPRIGETFRLFVAENGMDVVRALYLDLTGQSVPAGQVREGRKWAVESRDLAGCPVYFQERILTLAGWLRSFRGLREVVWLNWEDPAPLVILTIGWFARHLRHRSWAALKSLGNLLRNRMGRLRSW